jgi:hypothetical protein
LTRQACFTLLYSYRTHYYTYDDIHVVSYAFFLTTMLRHLSSFQFLFYRNEYILALVKMDEQSFAIGNEFILAAVKMEEQN